MHILYKVQSEEEQFDKIILLLSNELLPWLTILYPNNGHEKIHRCYNILDFSLLVPIYCSWYQQIKPRNTLNLHGYQESK